MSLEPFIGEIMLFGGTFAPRGWAFCFGQVLAISTNTALFSIIGTTFGGDGRSTFALPDLRGRAPLHPGQGPGLSLRVLGEAGGSAGVTLLPQHMPVHTHALRGADRAGTSDSPAGALPARDATGLTAPYAAAGEVPMAANAVLPAGGGLPHNNLPPFVKLNYVIALQGIYPPRS